MFLDYEVVMMMRSIALDAHRDFCEVAISERGRVRLAGRVATTPEALRVFGQDLRPSDQVVLEATGNAVGIARILEPFVERVVLADAKAVRAVAKARAKTDKIDARLLARLLAAGFLGEVWTPDEQTRARRRLVSRRAQLVRQRTREKNQVHAVLMRRLVGKPPMSDVSGVKLSSVASDIMGVSGRAMLDALVAGTNDPELLAELAKARLRAKLPALRKALDARFRDHHGFLVGQVLAHVDYLEEAIATVGERIDSAIAPFQAAVELLVAIPGVQRRTAEVVVAEIGVDMSRFATSRHLSSWAGLSPGNNESAGKRKHGRTTKGSPWLRTALVEAALGATRPPGYLRAKYWRVRGRRGHQRAVIAVAHSLLEIIHHVLASGELYSDLGNDYFERRQADYLRRRAVRQLERLGHHVTLTEAPTPQPA